MSCYAAIALAMFFLLRCRLFDKLRFSLFFGASFGLALLTERLTAGLYLFAPLAYSWLKISADLFKKACVIGGSRDRFGLAGESIFSSDGRILVYGKK